MKLNLKESSNIESASYLGNTLTVSFKSGGIYAYFDVPSGVVEEWLRAESVGKAFHSLIKKGSFSFQKISDVAHVG